MAHRWAGKTYPPAKVDVCRVHVAWGYFLSDARISAARFSSLAIKIP